ncbi:MAG: hypothetical protein FWE48_02280 [Coriobacteriia bacterium]|nr:hypothetical protein [Coriobacteriia bacterium]MCL2745909.1 hypothetical protein [Coriobacteriia bacterium]MCL2870827.1 hypothetical protein [Coriobacteriia bacterium]
MRNRKIYIDDIMVPAPAVATEDMTVAETTEHLRSLGLDMKGLHYIYLVRETDVDGLPKADSRLMGFVTLSELLLQDADKKLKSFARYDIPSTNPNKDPEYAAWLATKNKLLALPIVDKDERLVGMVTADCLIDAAPLGAEKSSSQDRAPSADAILEEAVLDASSNKDEKNEDDVAKRSDKPNSGAEDGKLRKALCKIGKGISWLFPQHASWVVLWLATSLAVYLGQNSLMLHADRLIAEIDPLSAGGEIPQFLMVMDFAFVSVQALLVVLPLILLTIHGGVMRGIKVYTCGKIYPTEASVRYLFAVPIGAIQAVISYALLVALYIMGRNFIEMSMPMESIGTFASDFWHFASSIFVLGIFLPLLLASLLTALFSAWIIGAVKAKHDKGLEIRPARAALAAMLVFVLSYAIVVYPAAHLWLQEQERAWEAQEQEFDFDFDEDFMFDEEGFGEEFMLDEGMMEEFGLGEGDMTFEDDTLYLDELLGEGELVEPGIEPDPGTP